VYKRQILLLNAVYVQEKIQGYLGLKLKQVRQLLGNTLVAFWLGTIHLVNSTQ
jgi:hypothetical protein